MKLTWDQVTATKEAIELANQVRPFTNSGEMDLTNGITVIWDPLCIFIHFPEREGGEDGTNP